MAAKPESRSALLDKGSRVLKKLVVVAPPPFVDDNRSVSGPSEVGSVEPVTSLRIAMGQISPVLGDAAGNADRVIAAMAEAEAASADLVVFPQMALTGYPPDDLLRRSGFIADNLNALHRVAEASQRCAAVVGFVDAKSTDAGPAPELFNAAALCVDGRIKHIFRKRHLRAGGPLNEMLYFTPASGPEAAVEAGSTRIAVVIGSDTGPEPGDAQLVIHIDASPFHSGIQGQREAAAAQRAINTQAPVVYVNAVGGQDELVFDGGSFIVGADGMLVARSPSFVPDGSVTELTLDQSSTASLPGSVSPRLDPTEEVYEALMLGTRDYVKRNGFSQVVLGLSGGVDSSLVAAVAADALGPENVHGVLMPSRYSSDHSVTDADRLAEALGIGRRTIPIEPAHAALLDMLAPSFAGYEPDLTEENIQARIRGVLLMALSNKFGWLVLTTGNKSETAVGYSTLYGDSAGGLAVLKDVPKMLVYSLCRWRNAKAGVEIIPETVLTKPPSAELRPDQTDQQSLPPYSELDALVEQFVVHDRTAAEVEAQGYRPEVATRVAHLIDVAEYKRRQGPPGITISERSLGSDRRVPITHLFRS